MTRVSHDEVDAFLDSTTFSGYQSVPLPGGRRVPGGDRTAIADVAFRDGVAGKSVLDVGTYYGFLPSEAMRRGATRAVGLEPDPERFQIARRIAELNGGYEILNGRLEGVPDEERFDLVCLLNVLHHVTDPMAMLRAACSRCTGTLVAEFCLPHDPAYIEYVVAGADAAPVSLLQRAHARARSLALRVAGSGLPLMAVGNRAYHRVAYFSPHAFRNLMVVHLGLASDVEFARSPDHRHRMVAFCHVSASAAGEPTP